MTSSSNDRDPRRGLSPATLVALGFLVLSVVASILIFQGIVPLPFAPAPTIPPFVTRTPEPATPPATVTVKAPIDLPTLAPTPTSVFSEQLMIGVAQLDSNRNPGVQQRIEEAFRTALQTVFLPDGPLIVREVSLPDRYESGAFFDMTQIVPGTTLLAAWRETDKGLIQINLYVAYTPPLYRFDQLPAAWQVYGTESVSVYADPEGNFALPAILAAGMLELYSDQPQRALDHFRAAQALTTEVPPEQEDGNRAATLFSIGQSLAETGELTTALQTFSQAIRLQPDFHAAQVDRGNIYLALGDAKTALAAYEGVITAQPDFLPAIYNSLLAHQRAGNQAASLDRARQLVELSDGSAWSLNLSGIVAMQQGNYEEAIAAFTAAGLIAPGTAVPLFNQAAVHYESEDYAGSLNMLEAALELEPNNPVFFAYLGRTYQALGDMARAERGLNRAIDLDKGYVEAYLWRAALLYLQEKYLEALDNAGTVLELKPDEGRAYVIIGDVQTALESYEEAEKAYSQAIDLGMDGAEVYARRGYSWHQRRYIQFAVLDYEEALKRGLPDLTVLYRLAMAYFDAGRYEDSLDAIQGAVNGGLDTADGYAILSLALDANLRRTEAEQSYKRAQELDERYGDVEYLRTLPLWSDSMIARAKTILARLDHSK